MDNPKIEWVRKGGRDCLKFTFQGSFRQQDAQPAIDKWREALASRPGERVVHIWDCLDMKDYEQEARTLWSEACKDLKDRIDVIWVVTRSMLIKMGATVISVFTSLNIKVVRSENDIRV
ncbi:MAG: hypothetical protein Kow0089_11330 [Desulfobulbaceae bacterium]